MDDFEGTVEVKISGNVRGRVRLPDFPCGCESPGTQGAKLIILGNGVRVCKAHGKRWQLMWEEV
jgi:hypothetical protein